MHNDVYLPMHVINLIADKFYKQVIDTDFNICKYLEAVPF
jgi:hypothetical protein